MTTDEATTVAAAAPPRPAAITAVAVLVGLQALLLVGFGAYLIAGDGDREIARMIEVSRGDVGVVGAVLVALGAIPALIAVGLFHGRDLARSLLAVVITLQLAPSVYALVAVQDTRVGSLVTVVLAVSVLWLLYGAPASEEYFSR